MTRPVAALRVTANKAQAPMVQPASLAFGPAGNPPLPIPDEMRLRVPEDTKLEMAS